MLVITRMAYLRPLAYAQLAGCVLVALVMTPHAHAQAVDECDEYDTHFELITGYVFSAPADMLDSQPGTLMLTDCIDMCRRNASCQSANYETGLCVLFSSKADTTPGALTTSQFPVFTLYVQKTCQPAIQCDKAWSFERVFGYQLEGFSKKNETVASRQACGELCASETDFVCRSANYNNVTGECQISDMDRHTLGEMRSFRPTQNVDYLENNCVDGPVKLCEFEAMAERILKTADSVFQDVASIEDCRQLCLDAPFRCHSFDYNDTAENVCRLSHHAVATLTHINEPYLQAPKATTYELSSCYNVTIDCRSGDMVVLITTSKVFGGKVYAKGSPNTCVKDVDSTLEFELEMSYNDIECNVEREGPGQYSNDVVIQHHDYIVTSSDLGLSLFCQYDMTNKTVTNEVDLTVTGDIQPTLKEESIVDSPNVIMRVADSEGVDVAIAQVGDPLNLRFEILDVDSPYEIFVRDLTALDGTDNNEILLIDGEGCPTDRRILNELLKVNGSGKILSSAFEAFKFPTSDLVQFRALVTPCLPTCEPAVCETTDYVGQLETVESYGRKRRWIQESHSLIAPQRRATRAANKNGEEEFLVVQSIRIGDKFAFNKKQQKKDDRISDDLAIGTEAVLGTDCINMVGLVVACSLFLLAQLALIVGWVFLWQRRRRDKLSELMPETTTSSLCQLYDSGYPRRA